MHFPRFRLFRFLTLIVIISGNTTQRSSQSQATLLSDHHNLRQHYSTIITISGNTPFRSSQSQATLLTRLFYAEPIQIVKLLTTLCKIMAYLKKQKKYFFRLYKKQKEENTAGNNNLLEIVCEGVHKVQLLTQHIERDNCRSYPSRNI